MSKKNKVKSINLYAEEYERKDYAFQSARLSVFSRTEEVIMKKLAVDIYPDGPDKQRAQDELDKAQQRLIVSIGAMDARKQELIEYYTSNFEKIKESFYGLRDPRDYGTSHEVVECTVRNFYKR